MSKVFTIILVCGLCAACVFLVISLVKSVVELVRRRKAQRSSDSDKNSIKE